VSYAEDLYHRLVLVVGPSGVGKTGVLHDVRARIGAPLLNVNLELTRSMLGLTARQRVLHLPRLLAEIVASPGSDVVLLDSVEVLFDVSLRQDPLRLLQGLSRDRTVVAAWNGEIKTVGAGQAEESGVTPLRQLARNRWRAAWCTRRRIIRNTGGIPWGICW
jgi:predicted ATPase